MGQYATIKDQYVRLTADFDNFRRRSQTEKESLSTAAKEDVVKLFLPLIDNFDLARQQLKPATEGEEKINNSYQGLYRQMVEIFRKLGVEAVETVGAAFDPNLHEAIMRCGGGRIAMQLHFKDFARPSKHSYSSINTCFCEQYDIDEQIAARTART